MPYSNITQTRVSYEVSTEHESLGEFRNITRARMAAKRIDSFDGDIITIERLVYAPDTPVCSCYVETREVVQTIEVV